MPNDCTNSFTITNITTDQWDQIARTFQVRDPDDQQDFLKIFYPEPDYSVTPVAQTHPEIDAQFADNEEDRQRILRNEPTIREDSWCDWRVQNWGTKWDVYSCCNVWEDEQPSSEFSAGFCTAWSPLSDKCMELLSKKFPGSLLTNYYEEGGMDFFGVTIAKDGVVRDFCDSMSKYREPFVRQQFPDLDARLEEQGLDLEDDLEVFFCENCESGEFYDFIFAACDSLTKIMIREVEVATSDCLVPA